jgi:voltage-gated potassium channel
MFAFPVRDGVATIQATMWGLARYYRRSVSIILRHPGTRMLLGATVIILGLGTIVYRIAEGWSWVDSFYFCAITLATIGYGDFTPTSDFTKLFTVLYALLGLGIVATFVTVLVRAPYEAEKRDTEVVAGSRRSTMVLPERPRYRRIRLGTASMRNRR